MEGDESALKSLPVFRREERPQQLKVSFIDSLQERCRTAPHPSLLHPAGIPPRSSRRLPHPRAAAGGEERVCSPQEPRPAGRLSSAAVASWVRLLPKSLFRMRTAGRSLGSSWCGCSFKSVKNHLRLNVYCLGFGHGHTRSVKTIFRQPGVLSDF